MEDKKEMHQREKIAWYVLRGELIDSERLNECYECLGGPNHIRSRAEEAEWLVRNVSPLSLSEYFDLEYVRVCTHCGKPMGWGYCIEGGCEYYCSEECMHQHYSEEEWLALCDDGKGESYYTAWID